jgi:DNA-directed RNA polymerase subunit alpha
MLELEKTKVDPRIEIAGDNRFVVEPLERGFGTTLGNSLRRVLLSSLVGAAVTHIRIDGVLHEFSTIPGVVEDVTEIVLNIKRLNIRMHTDRRKILRVEAIGEGRILAADIVPDAEVEILNPELHIATLTEKNARLIMDLYVEKGTGYVPAEKQTTQEQILGLIPVDSIFSPIRKVQYLVEDTRVKQKTDYDKLTLEVDTDGSIAPYEAVISAAQILQSRLNLFTNLRPQPQAASQAQGPETSIYDMPIESLGLSVRSLNCLKRAGVKTVGELTTYTEEDVMKLKNFGQKSLEEIKEKLEGIGLTMRLGATEE